MRLQSGCGRGLQSSEGFTPLPRRPTHIAVSRRLQFLHRAAAWSTRYRPTEKAVCVKAGNRSAFYDLVLEVTCSFCALQVSQKSSLPSRARELGSNSWRGHYQRVCEHILKPPQVILLRYYFAPNLLIQCNPNKTPISFVCFLFWPHCTACGILVPRPGIEPGPQEWKHRVLTTGPPGNSHRWNKNIMLVEKKSKKNQKQMTLPFKLKAYQGTSLVVQWVRLCAPNAEGLDSIPGRGTRSCMHAATKEFACRNQEVCMLQLRSCMPQLRPGAA